MKEQVVPGNRSADCIGRANSSAFARDGASVVVRTTY